MNTIILRGRLTDTPEIKITTDQKPTTIARFTLAVQDRSHRNHEGNYDVDFIKMVAFNGLADNIQQYTDKGSEIIVTGRLHTYSYDNKEGKRVYIAEVIVEKLEFVASCNKPETPMDIPDDSELPFK